MPTIRQNPTGKHYIRRIGLCDCGAQGIVIKHGESVCADCDAIERGFLAHNHRIRGVSWMVGIGSPLRAVA